MRSASPRSFAARSALLALAATLGVPACFSSNNPPPVPINGGGGDPCPNGCEDSAFVAVSTTGSGSPLCTAETAAQSCFDGDVCTKDICLFGACAHTPSNACKGPGAFVFAEGYGITDAPQKISVAAGPDGTTVVAALFSDNVLLATEGPVASFGRSLLVRKLDAKGQPFWTRVFSGANGIHRVAVVEDDAGNVYLTGGFHDGSQQPLDFGSPPLGMLSSNETVFVAKLDTAGAHVWSKAIPGSLGAAGESVALDAKGRLAVSGTMTGTLDFGSGPIGDPNAEGSFVATLDADGKTLWSRAFVTTNGGDYPGHHLAFAPSGDLVVAGSFSGKADVGAGPIGSSGVPGAFVTRLDPLGATVWSQGFLSPGGDVEVQGAAVDSTGTIYVSGSFSGMADLGASLHTTTSLDDRDLFVFGLGADGTPVWSRAFGNATNQSFCTVAAGAAAEVKIAGIFTGSFALGGAQLATTTDFDQDVFVGALDAAGNDLWGRRFGDFHRQGATSLAVDAQGNLVVGGFFLGPIDFGIGPFQVGQPGVGSFVAKLSL